MDKNARKMNIGESDYSKHEIQPWDIIEEYGLDFWEGNALKYLLRKKNSRKEDLQKAIHYLEKCVERHTPVVKVQDKENTTDKSVEIKRIKYMLEGSEYQFDGYTTVDKNIRILLNGYLEYEFKTYTEFYEWYKKDEK